MIEIQINLLDETYRRLVPARGRCRIGLPSRVDYVLDLASGDDTHRRRGCHTRGYAGFVLPRSGLASRHGIALVNSPGLVDSGYRGEMDHNDHTDSVKRSHQRGDRIAQLVIKKWKRVLRKVDEAG